MHGRGSGVITALAVALAIPFAAPAAASDAPTLPSQDPFYSYSGSLAGVAPGTVLKTRPVTISDIVISVPFSATQVLYRTTGELGQPTVTVATIVKPLLPVATKILSYQSAYDGLGPQCEPSYTLRGGSSGDSTATDEEQLVAIYVAAGDTVVVPDYEGVQQEWGAGQESGYGTLDGVRAAESALGVSPAGTPVALLGYSGGSIATEFATELQPTYASGLDIVGAAEGGIPVDFAHNLAYINGSKSWSGVIPAVLVALGLAFTLDVAKYASPYGAQVAHKVQDECINSFLGKYPGLTIQKLLKSRYRNFLAIPQIAKLTNHLIMTRAGTPRAPLFIGVGNADGTGDGVMVAADVEALAHTYCQRGVSVQFNEYQGSDHTAAAIKFEPGAFQFLTARLSGQSVSNGCGSVGPGDSLAPLPVAAIRYLSISPQRHRVVVALRVAGGTFRGLLVKLQRANTVVAKITVRRVNGSWRRVVLRGVRRPGTYTVTVSQAGTTLFSRRLHIR